MKRIFISTDYEKLQLVIGDNRDKMGINLIANNEILIFKDGAFIQFDPSKLEGVTLFLVKDTAFLTNSDKQPFIKINNEKEDYLMRHTACNHANYFKSSNIHDKGMHEEGDQFYSYVLNNIILSPEILENDKAAKIIEFLFPSADAILGKKLDLLHHLLVPPTDFTTAKEQWEELKKAVKSANDSGVKVTLSSDENALDVFETESTGKTDAFDSEYLSALRKLRDKLLAS